MSWTSNAPIHFRLGTIALWNCLTRRVVKNDTTLDLLKKAAPALFEDLINSPTPATMSIGQ